MALLRYSLVLVSFVMTFATLSHASPDTVHHWLNGVPASGEKAFLIYRKEKPVGFQHVRFDKNGEDLQVTIHAEITIKFGFITVFNYVHHNVENWRQGSLVSLSSHTDNNGKYEFASVSRNANGELVSNSSRNSGVIGTDLMTTSYFIPSFVKQTALINSQNGKVLNVSPNYIGKESIAKEDGVTDAYRYRLQGDLALDIWYDQQGQWQKSAFVPNGNKIQNLDPLSKADAITYQPVLPSVLPERELWQVVEKPAG